MLYDVFPINDINKLNKLLIVNKISHFPGDYGSYLNDNILKFKVLSSQIKPEVILGASYTEVSL